MSKTIVLEQALILPANDITAMLQGQLIVAIPKVQIAKGLSFLLAPEQLNSQTKIIERYRSPFSSLAEIVPSPNEEGSTRLEAWATCEQTKMIHDVGQIPTLSSLTVWNQSYLEELLKEQQYLFLTYLKVYRLPGAITIPSEKLPIGKIGKFVGLLSMECSSVQVTESLPILSDRLFEQRKKKLEDLTPPEHPELEELQSAIASYSQAFNDDIQWFLGWKDQESKQPSLPDWVKQISILGRRGEETEKNKKSHYQAGTDFEIIVRDSFKHIGFTMDKLHQGKAGGIDAFCSEPYSIAIECKSGKGIPDNTVEELERIAKRHLKDNYQLAIKLIIGPGNPTKQLSESANISNINIMQPETLQRLVKLKVNHPGAIDLLELEPCLRREPFGTDSDKKVNDFIDQAEKRIEIRSKVIQAVKSLKEDGDNLVNASDVRNRFNAFASLEDRFSNPEETHDILIELSSPLTGYLGRIKCDTWRGDRFYFLRDLVV